MNAPFATALAGWKASAKNKLAWPLVPNVADVDSAESIDAMAASVAEHANAEQADAWREVTRQRRVLSFELLAGTLASR
jgi:hypothetical protein